MWYFGWGAALDFNGGAPVPLEDCRLKQLEGSSSIADPLTGQLLFYTDGNTIFDRNHDTMPDGRFLFGDPNSTGSSTQAALILPLPGDSSKYYVFITPAYEDIFGLSYVIVDMSLRNGLGEVVGPREQVLSSSQEKVTALRLPDKKGFWIVSAELGSNNFYAFKLTGEGLSKVPTVSAAGLVHSTPIGCLKSSPDGRKLICAVAAEGAAELLDFDPVTGVVSNPVILDTRIYGAYGVSFSPDNSKVYVASSIRPFRILQYDLKAGSLTAIRNSATVVAEDSVRFCSMQLGPDLKLYCSRYFQPSLAVIASPNARGVACNYIREGIALKGKFYPGGARSSYGLPNFVDELVVEARTMPRAQLTISATTICAGACIDLADRSSYTFPGSRTWSRAETGDVFSEDSLVRLCFDQAGIYRIRLVASNANGRDTAEETLRVYETPKAEAGNDISICSGEEYRLSASGGETYLWSPAEGLSDPSSPDPVASPSETTKYFVTVRNGSGCEDKDSLVVAVRSRSTVSLVPGTASGDLLPGDTATIFVDINTKGDAAINALRLELGYNTSALRYIDKSLNATGGLAGWSFTVYFDSTTQKLIIEGTGPSSVSPAVLALKMKTYLVKMDSLSLPVEISGSGSAGEECVEIHFEKSTVELAFSSAFCSYPVRAVKRMEKPGSLGEYYNSGSGSIIPYLVHAGGHVSLKIYNETGLQARALVDEYKQPGSYEHSFDASDLASGIYYCVLQIDSFICLRSFAVIR